MLDSGASNHYSANKSAFMTYRQITPIPIETASHVIHAVGTGDVIIHLTCSPIPLFDILHVPQMISQASIISVGQLETKGIEFAIKNGIWNLYKYGSLWAVAIREKCVYFLQEMTHSSHVMISFPTNPTTLTTPLFAYLASAANQPEKALPASTAPTPELLIDTQDIDIWHRRIGHLNWKYVQRLQTLSEGMEIGQSRKYHLDFPDCVCST